MKSVSYLAFTHHSPFTKGPRNVIIGPMGLLRDRIKRFFLPVFSELSLFMIGLSFVLVFLSTDSLRSGLFELLHAPVELVNQAILLVFFGAGLVLSLYHVFAKRKKTKIEKQAMLGFAVVSNAICGILASLHILGVSVGGYDFSFILHIRNIISGTGSSTGASRLFLILPIWNIINCVFLLMSVRTGFIDDRNISDEKADRFEVLFGFLITVAIFVVCRFGFKLYWAITFSICVIYATSFGDALGAFLHPEERQMAEERAAADINIANSKLEKCGFCGRLITSLETPYVINRKLIVCKHCHGKIQSQK